MVLDQLTESGGPWQRQDPRDPELCDVFDKHVAHSVSPTEAARESRGCCSADAAYPHLLARTDLDDWIGAAVHGYGANVARVHLNQLAVADPRIVEVVIEDRRLRCRVLPSRTEVLSVIFHCVGSPLTPSSSRVQPREISGSNGSCLSIESKKVHNLGQFSG